MKAIGVREGEYEPRTLEVPEPTPTDGEVLVRTLRVGIDGTDHEAVRGGHGGFPEGEDYMVLGHEVFEAFVTDIFDPKNATAAFDSDGETIKQVIEFDTR